MDQHFHSPSGDGTRTEFYDQQHHPKTDEMMSTGGVGHQMSASDPGNPQNWPLMKKVYASLCATAFAFAVAFGLTSYTSGVSGAMEEFNVSVTLAIIPFSIYLVGIVFAPIHTPHLSEQFGRVPVYFVALLFGSFFISGGSLSPTFAGLCICRFLAGFFGGPTIILIEGTYSDLWSPKVTVAYYSFLTLASYIGAGCGILITGFPVITYGWRWSQHIPLIVALLAYLLGISVPETYGREIIRTRAHRAGKPHNLSKAQSGVTLSDMAKYTIVDLVIMLVSEPIVIGSTLYICFLFGTIFQWFISVPVILNLNYSFSVGQAGLAFFAALIGTFLAAATCVALDRYGYAEAARKSTHLSMIDIEYRFYPAMLGAIFVTASLFCIGWTALPTNSYYIPITGTGVYVYGNMMCFVSTISYLFDAYPPTGTLSALTTAAFMRILVGAAIPLVIIQVITGLGGGWAYSAFGIISAVLIPFPFVMYKWGPRLRSKSKYTLHNTMGTTMQSGGQLNWKEDWGKTYVSSS